MKNLFLTALVCGAVATFAVPAMADHHNEAKADHHEAAHADGEHKVYECPKCHAKAKKAGECTKCHVSLVEAAGKGKGVETVPAKHHADPASGHGHHDDHHDHGEKDDHGHDKDHGH